MAIGIEAAKKKGGVGIRFPVGSAYLIDGAPVDVFFELVPTLDLVPATSVDLDFALGARYWFN